MAVFALFPRQSWFLASSNNSTSRCFLLRSKKLGFCLCYVSLLLMDKTSTASVASGTASVNNYGTAASAVSPVVVDDTTLDQPTIASSSANSIDNNNNNRTKRLTLDTMSRQLRKMEYAVRGKVVMAADRIAADLLVRPEEYNFGHIVFTNIGNPQSVGQQPLTWPRQVLALTELPPHIGVDHPAALDLFPSDAIRRAKEILRGLQYGTGAYSHSKGVQCLREDVAHFIQQRDGGIPSDPEQIFLTNGASNAITMILNALIANDKAGVMVPIPQYPIYSAMIDLMGGNIVGYYLNEENGWSLDLEELERSIQEAQQKGIEVNSLVLINPGNPTGQVLSRENLHDIVRFCVKHNLVLMADEVYQENVYDDNAVFVSSKRAAYEVGLLDQIELISFHSVSKGVFGECGRRGGYMELIGIDPAVSDEIYKLASASLCSTVSGQVMTSLMVRGPKPDDVSYEHHESEKHAVLESLKRRSKLVSEGLNRIPGFSCQPAQGAMYCFPSVQMPPGALVEAEKQGTSPDTLYCVSLLETTGICVVPASGFGQKPGRYGFRTTILPPEDEMNHVIQMIANHYKDFCHRYSQSN